MLEGDFDLIALTRKLSAISLSSVSSGDGSVMASTTTKKQLGSCLTTVVVSPAPSPHRVQYIGQCSSRDSDSIAQSIEFSQISDYCDRLLEDQAKVSTICSGDFGLGSTSHQQARRAHSNQNGLSSTFCKVGSGAPVQVESKCCSVV
ncbi:unnamed protein product [Lymnaea stagnalis]|uniref:Uncharacterized protein n=1 Tax=Lymnaea stagnalis TaxID=6523 RepID=A0AAV2HD61_LYMST